MQVFQPFSPFFAHFRRFSCVFCTHWPPGPTCRAELGAEHRNRGPGARAGRQRRPRRPVAAAAPRGPPGPERRRRERRGEPRRPGAREPGAERPPGGQPGRSGQRGSASTVEGTATRARRDRLPRTPGARAGRRGGRRVGDSGAGGQRPGGPQADRPRKRAGPGTGHDRPHTAIAVGRALCGAEASRWVPPDQSAAPGAGEGPGGGPPAQTLQAAQRRPRVGRRRD